MVRLSVVLASLAACAAAQPPAGELDRQMRSVLGAYAIAERNAADPITAAQAFYQGAIPGLLRTLDPHSVFFDPDQFEQLRHMESSTQKGFGSVVSLLPGRVIVLQTLPGTPSAKAGLAPGDEILAVNGYIIARLDLEQLTELLGVSRQREARLDVRRPGESRIMQLTLTPEEMQSDSVERAFFVGPGAGYIRVASFDENTPRQLKAAIEKLGGTGLKGLVLDLRNNPGGLLTAAVQTASLFLRPGLAIVTVRGRNVPEKTESVPSLATPYLCKLAILINGKSASATEIVAGAMQDHDRAAIVGEPSFGKGLVQSVFPLNEGTGVALTTALYYTPSGRSIQKPLDTSRFELGGATAHPNVVSEFRTDNGRKVTGGGGIQPDAVVYPLPMNRLRVVLEASGSFADFAAQYLRAHQVTLDFEVTPELMDQFRVFLDERQISPSVGEWSIEADFIKSRLQEEIFTLAFGVEKGDEIQARRDPVILKAVEAMGL
jgi:carboxyl-terminal processing protease